MRTSDFYYDLPEELIAQVPASPRDSSRLLCLHRGSGAMEHRIFHELPSILQSGDLLVINNSKVIPARLLGQKEGSGGLCELLLLREVQKDIWECLARPGKRMRPGTKLIFGDGSLSATILETLKNGGKLAEFHYNTGTLQEKLDEFGQMPLPPYIHERTSKPSDYQTVYAKQAGSAAAPTAGLHFTPELIRQLQDKNIEIAELTLHVGLGTFLPVKEAEIEDHTMHTEWYQLDSAAAGKIQTTKENGGRVIAVGTTSCRTLETIATRHGSIVPSSGETDIFIYPGYSFQVIDGLLTNFHLPESTLLMLVSAFCGQENTLKAYEEAVKRKYRFFSFGDAMLIL